ncbi:MAG: type II toxin-antitoxin system HicB family antitoxin [Ignavibacteria bacterium]|nr:type II toxin-antitoxin system HicB family antitoxin [Ignavibacteria bacterium]
MKKNLSYYMKLNYPIEIIEIPKEEGGGYSACIPSLGRYSVIADGETIEEAIDNVKKLKDQYLKELYQKGIPIPEPIKDEAFEDVSGRFVLRIPKELHKFLIEKAKQNEVSLNQYVLYLLTKSLSEDSIESKLQSFIQKFESITQEFIETEYDLNFDFKHSQELLLKVHPKKNIYMLKAG